MGFDLPWDILATLDRGVRIHYSGAYPPRNQGCTELLARIVILKRDKYVVPALPSFWALRHISVIVLQHPHSQNRWNVP